MLALRYDLLLGGTGRKIVAVPRPGFIPQDGRVVGEESLPKRSLYLGIGDPERAKAEAAYFIVDVASALATTARIVDVDLSEIPPSVYENSRTAAVFGLFSEKILPTKDRMVVVDPASAADALFILTSTDSQIGSNRSRISSRAMVRASILESRNYNAVMAVSAIMAISLTYAFSGKKDEKKAPAPQSPTQPTLPAK